MLELQLTDIRLRYSRGYIYVDGKVNGQWVQLIREQSYEQQKLYDKIKMENYES